MNLSDAYAAGWAASGGPLTDRVKAGHRAILSLTPDYPPTSDLLEIALHLGHLEGVWATKFDRWEKLLTKHLPKIQAKWRDLTKTLDLTAFITAIRVKAGLSEAADPAFPPAATSPSTVTADEITTVALTLLQGLSNTVEDYADLEQLAADMLDDAAAEGMAGALALSADQAGVIGFDFDIAFEDMLKRVDSLGGWASKDPWLAKALNGTASDLGKLLAPMARDGATWKEMFTAAQDILTGTDPKALTYTLDVAFGQAMSGGALDLWTSEGVGTVNWLDAGDERVCPICEGNTVGSPYTAAGCPIPPVHGFCRCSLQANDAIPNAAFDKYVSDNLDLN